MLQRFISGIQQICLNDCFSANLLKLIFILSFSKFVLPDFRSSTAERDCNRCF